MKMYITVLFTRFAIVITNCNAEDMSYSYSKSLMLSVKALGAKVNKYEKITTRIHH